MREGSNGTKVQAFLRRPGERRHVELSLISLRRRPPAAVRPDAAANYPSILVP